MFGVQRHLYDKFVFVFGFEQFYRRFFTPPDVLSKSSKEIHPFGCELGFMSGYKAY